MTGGNAATDCQFPSTPVTATTNRNPRLAVVGGDLPAVTAFTDVGVVLLLGPDELEACGGSPDRLAEALVRAAESRELDWG